MPKLLRAVRLDDSDDHVFAACGAARDGEPVVTGGFAVCEFDTAPRCDPVCHCQASFLATGSPARCTIAEVREVTDEEMDAEIQAFAWHLLKRWNAPSWEAALAVAEEEIRHTAGVCETLAPDVWITVKRTRAPDGAALEEEYSVYDRLMIGSHEVG